MDLVPAKVSSDIDFGCASRQRLLLTFASGIAAIYLGFFAFTPSQAQGVVRDYGYYLITFTLGWFIIHLAQIGRASPKLGPIGDFGRVAWWQAWLRKPRCWVLLTIASASLLCVIAEPAREKIIYDEYVIQATAMHIHFTRKVSALVQAYDVNDVFLPMRDYLDKRPYFFALLLSLIHDFTGYRLGNVYWLNGGLTVLTLSMLYLLVRRLANFYGAILSVLLMGSLPLLAQNSTGSGMEVLNVMMILLSLWLGILAIENPTENRLGAFVLAVVLLAQTRYESALYVFAVVLVMTAVWWRKKQIILPWAAVAAPLLMVPIPLLQLVLYAHPIMWDLPRNLDSRFGFSHVSNNLNHAAALLTSVSSEQPNSPLLVLLGVTGVGAIVGWIIRRPSRLFTDPACWVVVSFALVVLANLALLMFYFWGELDDPMVSRLALPLYALLACCAAVWLSKLDATRPATRWGIAAALIMVPLTYGRAAPLHLYTSRNLVSAEIRWETAWVASLSPGPRFILTNKSCLPWLLRREASTLLSGIRDRGTQLAFHLREGTFVEILVMQRLRATTSAGDMVIDADDQLPPNFHLTPIVEKRFGITIDRVSRLTSVDVVQEPRSP